MESNAFYCPACKHTLAGEFGKNTTPDCPDCKKPVIFTGYTKKEWVELSQKEKDAVIEDISRQSPPEIRHTESTGTKDKPAGESIFTFAEAYCPNCLFVRTILIILLGLGILISLIGMGMPGALFVGLPMIGAAILGLMDLYLACWFYKAAILKGHTDRAYFWIAFIFTAAGYLLVASLPDRGSPEA